MSQQMLNRLHADKISEINKDERLPLKSVPAHVKRDAARLKEAQDLERLLSGKIRNAGYEPDSFRASDGPRRPYDWRRKEKSERIQKLSTLKTETQIALMKCARNDVKRAEVMERYLKALRSI